MCQPLPLKGKIRIPSEQKFLTKHIIPVLCHSFFGFSLEAILFWNMTERLLKEHKFFQALVRNVEWSSWSLDPDHLFLRILVMRKQTLEVLNFAQRPNNLYWERLSNKTEIKVDCMCVFSEWNKCGLFNLPHRFPRLEKYKEQGGEARAKNGQLDWVFFQPAGNSGTNKHRKRLPFGTILITHKLSIRI